MLSPQVWAAVLAPRAHPPAVSARKSPALGGREGTGSAGPISSSTHQSPRLCLSPAKTTPVTLLHLEHYYCPHASTWSGSFLLCPSPPSLPKIAWCLPASVALPLALGCQSFGQPWAGSAPYWATVLSLMAFRAAATKEQVPPSYHCAMAGMGDTGA